jgi:hypothetical protein
MIHRSNSLCDSADGTYNPLTGQLIICVDSGQAMNNTLRDTIVHEMFHAIQYTYDKALRDRQNNKHEHWSVEGMAMAAERSFALGKMARSFYYGETNLRKIDVAITEGIASDLLPDEYLAQDFWVLLGQYNNAGLGYLDEILLYGGVTLNGVHDAWNFAGPGPATFSQIYWEWVKNQVLEHTYDLGGGLGDVCKLTPNALTNGTHITFPFSQMYYPADYTWVELAPLTAQLFEVQIPHTRNGALIQVRYEECEGHTDPQAERTCHDGMKPLMRAKVYVEEEANCHLSSLPGVLTPYEGERMISPIVQGQRYFILIANADKDKPHKFAIALE